MTMGNEVEEIKDKIDIADLMSEYVKLVPAGANFKALCPFHNEKTPSMMISSDKNIFKCFGCGVGGDIFEFLMKIEGYEFPEAKKILAKKAGVVLPEYNSKESSQRTRLIKVMELAKKYYNYVLLNSESAKSALDYLISRGLNNETIIDWEIGYSPDSWSSLYDFCSKRGFTDNEIFLAGLTIKKKNGVGFFDRFRGRIMFPISDKNGNTLAFTARVSPQNEATEQMGKYVNSPQTELYNKSEILFGLDKAKSEIRKQDRVIVVEGQMDVIASYQAGFKNVVASSGTALTAKQFKIIKKITPNIIFALDSDMAGQTAIEKSYDIIKLDSELAGEINIKVIEIIGGKDPDDLIRNNPQKWEEAISNAKPIIKHYFDTILTGQVLGDFDEKMRVVKYLLPKIKHLSGRVETDYWIRELSEIASVSEGVLRDEMRVIPQNISNLPQKPAGSSNKIEVLSKDLQLFRKILAVIIRYPTLISRVSDELKLEYINNELPIKLYKKLILFYTKRVDLRSDSSVDKSEIDLYKLLKEQLEGDNSGNEVIGLLDESFLLSEKDFSDLNDKEARSELNTIIGILKSDYLNNKINILNSSLREAEDKSDSDKIESISTELLELLKQK
jgi:DNA primase